MNELDTLNHAQVSQQIVDVLTAQFGADFWKDRLPQESLWIAMQVLCGPHQAAVVVRCCTDI